MAIREIVGALKITILGNPVTKKNSQQILKNRKTGKSFIAPSKKYTEYENSAYPYIIRYAGKMINCAVNVQCIFYMETRRKVDLTNLLEAVDDILVNYHVVEDDNSDIIFSHDGSRVFHDKDNPRVEITISKVEW